MYGSEGLGDWILPRYDDVLAATRHPALGSARAQVSDRTRSRGYEPVLAGDFTRMTTGMLRGRTIWEGDLICLSLGAANRDPEAFAEPDGFHVDRTDNRHLAFGAGPHICPGMTLARRELEISVGRLVQRMPRLRLDEERPMRRRSDTLVFRGLESLPVRFD